MTRNSLAWALVAVVLGAEALGISLLNLPRDYDFLSFASRDPAANLAILDMIDRGDRPGLDDGYHYGLLPIAFSQVWYGVLGRTPWASVAATVLGNLIVGLTLGRFAGVARVGPVGLALLVAAMPFVVVGCYFMTYVLEPVLLGNALLEQARGRRPTALALVTAAAFVRPSLAFVYGLILVLLILRDAWRSRSERPFGWSWLRPFVPAAATGATLVLGFAWAYGVESLVNSLFPARAMDVYRANHFGFFHGLGRNFWRPPGATIGYYLGTVACFWLAGSVVLIAGGIEGLVRRGDRAPANAEVVATCAALHAAFVALFFAHAWSWNYYIYVIVMGLSALAPRSRAHAATVALLAGLAVLAGARTQLTTAAGEWRSKVRAEATYGLFASPVVAREWAEVRARLGGNEAAVLGTSDGLGVSAPGFAPPRLFYLVAGQMPPGELERKRDQLEAAGLVVEIKMIDGWPTDRWAMLRRALAGAEPLYRGTAFRLYRRPAGGGPPVTADRGKARLIP